LTFDAQLGFGLTSNACQKMISGLKNNKWSKYAWYDVIMTSSNFKMAHYPCLKPKKTENSILHNFF